MATRDVRAAKQRERDLRPRSARPRPGRRVRCAAAAALQNAFLALASFVVPRLSRAGELRLARALGRLTRFFAPHHRKRAEANLRIAFGASAGAETVRDLVRRSFAHQALVAMDFFWFSKDEGRFAAMTEVGDETARRWLSGRGPAFFVTAHLGNWELAARTVAANGRRISSVFRPFGSGAVSRRMRAFRERCGQGVIPRDGAVRGILRALRAGEAVGIVMDQHVDGRDGGLYLDFFGLPASFSPVVGTVAHKFGIPVFVCAMVRDEARDRYVFHAVREFAAERVAAESPEAITRQLAAALEEAVRRWPEQWLWSYRRWKRWPPGDDPARYPDYAREDPCAAPAGSGGA